jgi:hypothetical protein
MYYSGPHLHEKIWCLTLVYNILCDTASGGSNMLSQAIIYVQHIWMNCRHIYVSAIHLMCC